MTRVAAVDVGTNTVRLLVADDQGRPVERTQRITRLGKGVDAAKRLDPRSIERSTEAVAEFVVRARELGADRVRIAGTSALRDAANAGEFVAAVRAATGVDLDILDGQTEGRRAYTGATAWLDDGPYVVCDIGGGSTELITSSQAMSVDIGSVRIRERFFASDPPSADDVAAARAAVAAELAGAAGSVGHDGQLVGVAGTITTVAALVLELETYDSERVHGARMSRADVDEWSRRLLSISAAEIAALGSVESGREDVIGAGSLVLSVVMDLLDAADVIVSERDILDGLVADLVG